VTLLVFLGGSSLLTGVAIVSACPKVLNDFIADVLEVDPFIVITSATSPSYQVLAFTSTRGSTKFEYSFDFLSSFCYFTRLFFVTSWEVGWIVFNARFDLADVEGIADKRKSTVCEEVECIVVPLLLDMSDAERSDLSRFEFLRCVQEVDVLRWGKNLLAGWKQWWNRPLLVGLFCLFDFGGIEVARGIKMTFLYRSIRSDWVVEGKRT